jgi:hypothetical protein
MAAITLAQAAQAAKRYAARQRKADEARDSRDRMVVALSEQGVPHRVIAEAVDLSLPAVGKITRAGGIQHWVRRQNPTPLIRSRGEREADPEWLASQPGREAG